ncbi:hypothetical protein RB195_013548 [Necator americanus]
MFCRIKLAASVRSTTISVAFFDYIIGLHPIIPVIHLNRSFWLFVVPPTWNKNKTNITSSKAFELRAMIASLLPFLLLITPHFIPYSCGQVLVQYHLRDLWRTRRSSGVHLFPTLISSVYPGFAGFKRDTGASRIHMSTEDVQSYAKELNGSEVISICSYTYMKSVFYVVNTDEILNGDTVEISLNLTMLELETTTEEMLAKQMKPSYICRGADGRFQ